MELQELEQLLRESPDGVRLVCFDGYFYDTMRCVIVEKILGNELFLIDEEFNNTTIGTYALQHYRPATKTETSNKVKDIDPRESVDLLIKFFTEKGDYDSVGKLAEIGGRINGF